MSRKPKVAAVSLKWDAVAYYRAFMPLGELARQGKIELLDNRRIYEADIVLFQRVFLPPHSDLIADLKRQGIRIVYDIDDDPFNVPPQHPNHATYRKGKVRGALVKVLSSCDLIIASTEPLADELDLKLEGRVRIKVVGNSLDFKSFWNLERFQEPERVKTSDKIVIGWAGALGHKGDLQLLRGLFSKLVSRYGDKLIFRFLGYHPEYIHSEVARKQVEVRSWVEIQSYPEALHRMGLDIGLIPLADNPHNRCKTELKFLEFSALKIPCAISDVGPYRKVPPDCAALVENNLESWLRAVSSLIENPELRCQIAASAHSYVLENYDIRKKASLWLEALLQAGPDLNRSPFVVASTRNESYAGPDKSPPRPVDVIIPIYNAYEETARCISSVLENTDLKTHRLILIDDGSTDTRIRDLLDELKCRSENITVLTHPRPLGFVRSCNEGAKVSDNDIILLNSDTVVPRGWVEKLIACAYSDAEIGVVSPLSNSAVFVNIALEKLGEDARDPYALESVNAFLERKAYPYYQLPSASGFCMFVKRQVLDRYGLFDETFGPGYSEEVDFCLRIRPSHKSAVDTRTYVYHKGQASFVSALGQSKRRELAELNAWMAARRYPIYESLLTAWRSSDPLTRLRVELLETLWPKRKVMHVLHNFGENAGVELFAARLGRAMSDQFRSFFVYPKDGFLRVRSEEGFTAESPIPQMGAFDYVESNPIVEQAFKDYLGLLKPEIVHFHHLIFLPLSLPFIAKRSGARVIFTIHDNYLLCPDPFLSGRPSLEHCLDVSRCAASGCFARKFGLGADVAFSRRQRFSEIISRCADAVVVPSRYLFKVVSEVFNVRPIFIEHGVEPISVKRRPGRAIRIGYVGNATVAKGVQVLLDAFQMIRGEGVELHLYGNMPSEERWSWPAASNIFAHGPYSQDQLPEILSNIDIAVIPSLTPEGFCYVLSELASAKVPTLVARSGALPERAHPEMVFETVPENLAEKLRQIIRDPNLQERAVQYAYQRVTPFEREAKAYARLYLKLLSEEQRRL